jgi:hypothetical protein
LAHISFLGDRANKDLDELFEEVSPDKESKITEDVEAETDQKQRNPTRCTICSAPYLSRSEG